MVMPNGKRRPAVFDAVCGTTATDALFRLHRMVGENGALVAGGALLTEIDDGDNAEARAAKIDSGDESEHLSLGCASLAHLPGANDPLCVIGQTNGGKLILPT